MSDREAELQRRLDNALADLARMEAEYSLLLDRYNRQGLELGMAERRAEAAESAGTFAAGRDAAAEIAKEYLVETHDTAAMAAQTIERRIRALRPLTASKQDA